MKVMPQVLVNATVDKDKKNGYLEDEVIKNK